MKYEVLWTEAARDDLRGIHDYLLTVTSRNTAKRLTREIRQSTRFLPEFPRMYQVFEDSQERARHIVVHQWRVLYVIDDGAHCCNVLAVVHTHQHI
ncbi:MAG: type II toxin-antitoxin system RelE/ParE family toxin [Acidovorax sp.]